MKHFFLFMTFLLPYSSEAQVVERFDGPELTTANPWRDQAGIFVVDNGFLHLDGSGREGTFPCTLPIPYAATMQWTMDVGMNFLPSSSNYIRVYVYATQAGSAQQIYLLRIGYTDKNLSFCRLKGGKMIPLIVGEKGQWGSLGFSARIRLTLEENRKWTLYLSWDGTHFEKLGEYEEALPESALRTEGLLNLTCICKSKSMKNRYYTFDNIEVLSGSLSETPLDPLEPEIPEEPDVPELPEEPEVPVEPEEPETPDSGDEVPDLPAYPDEKEPDTSYEPGAILINEVMADPKGLTALPETEYVELYNASSMVISLADWTLIYRDKTMVVLPDLLLAPGQYALLYREGREVRVEAGAIELPLPKFPSALANTGNTLRLEDPRGVVIDDIAYEKAKRGVSWERDATGWHLSTDSRGGTPGAANSIAEKEPEKEPEDGGKEPTLPEEPVNPDLPQEPDTPDRQPEEPIQPDADGSAVAPGELLFNELLPNPFVGGSEYIELYNASGRTLSLQGLLLSTRKSDGTLSTRYSLASVGEVAAGGYLLLSKQLEGVEPFYLIRNPSALHELKLPILANTVSTLVLYRSGDGTVIDEVNYSVKWHASSVKNEKGVALERIRMDHPTQDATNWSSATEASGFGTPGYRNSQAGREDEHRPVGIEPPRYLPETGEYTIAYYLNEAGYNCRAWLFDTLGRHVAEIANHELIGSSGELHWNGMTGDGRRLQPGLYILYVVLYHPDGMSKQFKKAFLVH